MGKLSSTVSGVDCFSREAPCIDRLGNLPKDALDQILVRLPMMDLIRTCILSKKWRYTWCSVPDLTFNQKFLDDLNEGSGSFLPPSVVDHVLLLRKAPVRRFHLSDFSNGYNAHMDKWIIYLTRNGIQELCLQLDLSWQLFFMPSCLLSCKQLKVLVLSCHHIVVPHTFKDFSNLVDLDLKVGYAYERLIVDLVSYCPRLETLKLDYENGLMNLKIDAEKLKYLVVRGSFNNIYLSGCSKLTHCKIYLMGESVVEDEFGNINNLEKVLGCLPLLEELTVGEYFLQHLSLGTLLHRLVYGFEHLKFLCLNVNFRDSKEISTAVSIFRRSPKLETIEIMVTWEENFILSSDPYNWGDNDCVFYSLKKISITSMDGKPPEMEFLKFVLGNAPILEKMYVLLDEDVKAEECRILKSLLLFQRASVIAKVDVVEEN